MENFDTCVAAVLSESAKSRMSFKVRGQADYRTGLEHELTVAPKGHLDTYRFCDEVWTFIIKNIKFKLESNVTLDVDKVKIVACLAREKVP